MAGKRSASERTWDSYRPRRSDDYGDHDDRSFKRHNNMPSPPRNHSSMNNHVLSDPRVIVDDRDLNLRHPPESRDASRRQQEFNSSEKVALPGQDASKPFTAPPPPSPPPPLLPPPLHDSSDSGQVDAIVSCLAKFQETVVDSTIVKINLRMQEQIVEVSQKAVNDIRGPDNANSKTKRTTLENGQGKLRELQEKMAEEKHKTVNCAQELVATFLVKEKKAPESSHVVQLSRTVDTQVAAIAQLHTELDRHKQEVEDVKKEVRDFKTFEQTASGQIQELERKLGATKTFLLSKTMDIFGRVQGQATTIGVLRSDVDEWKGIIEEEIQPTMKTLQEQITITESHAKSDSEVLQRLTGLREDLGKVQAQVKLDGEVLALLQDTQKVGEGRQRHDFDLSIEDLRETVRETTERFGETDEFLRDEIADLRRTIGELNEYQSTRSNIDQTVKSRLDDLDGVCTTLTEQLAQKADQTMPAEFDNKLSCVTAKIGSHRLPTPAESEFGDVSMKRIEALEKSHCFLQDRYCNVTTEHVVTTMAEHFDKRYGFGSYREYLARLEPRLQQVEHRLSQLDVGPQLTKLDRRLSLLDMGPQCATRKLSAMVAQYNLLASRIRDIDRMQTKVDQNVKAIDDLQALRSTVYALETDIKALEKTTTENARAASVRQKDNDVMEVTREITSRLEAEYAKLSTSIKSNEQKFKDLSTRTENHESRLDQQDEKVTNFQADKIQLHQKLNDLENKAKDISKEHALKKDVQDVFNVLEQSAEAKSKDTEILKKELIERLDGFETALSQKSAQEDVEGLHEKMRQQHAELEQSVGSIQGRIDTTEPISIGTQSTLQELRSKVEALAVEDIKALPDNFVKLQAQVERLDGRLELQELSSKALAADEFKALPDNLKKLQTQVEDLHRRLQTLSAKTEGAGSARKGSHLHQDNSGAESRHKSLSLTSTADSQPQSNKESSDAIQPDGLPKPTYQVSNKHMPKVHHAESHTDTGTSTLHDGFQDKGDPGSSRVSGRPCTPSMKKQEALASTSSSKTGIKPAKRENTFPSTPYIQAPGPPKEAPRNKQASKSVIVIDE